MSERVDYIAGMRALADMLETNPGVSLPYDGVYGLPASIYISGDEPLAQAVVYAKAMDPRPTLRFKAHMGRSHFWLEVCGRIRGFHVLMNLRARDVCELVDGEPVPPPALLALAASFEQADGGER